MARQEKYMIGLFLVVCIAIRSECEIHRARGIKPRAILDKTTQTQRSTWPPGPHRPVESSNTAPSCVESIISKGDPLEISVERSDDSHSNSFTVWTYAICSAVLVGLSGIFPLLIIPIETGASLKSGPSAARLKLLLSFAVGGLLGDVFLHLLPEAWAHIEKEDAHSGHLRIGLWVIAGLLSFLITEKIFPDEEEEDEEKEQEGDQCQQYTKLSSNAQNGTAGETDHCYKQNGTAHLLSNGAGDSLKNGHASNGHVVQNGGEKIEALKSPAKDKSHIKTSGWLNLIANVVDNFTHGLAVAGSYCCGIKVGFLTTCAILLHEIPHEMGDFAILLNSGFNRWQAAKAQLATATGGLLGALTALTASSVEQAGKSTAWILPFTSGGFIYIALVTVVPDLLKEKNPRESFKQVLLLVCGILSMALVTLLSD